MILLKKLGQYCILWILASFLGCNSKQTSIHMNHKASIHDSLTPAFPVSGVTKSFLKEYHALSQHKNHDADSIVYVSLITRYKLSILPNREYALCGFIKVNTLFKPELLKKRGIEIQPQVGEFRTVCIPLHLIDFFFSQPGIDYFEHTQPANPL